jgi:hypothetical protein
MVVGEIRWDGVGCIRLARDRGQWRALVNAVIELRVVLKARNFHTTDR